ncbi:MAG: hypothetical protein ACREND_15985 [Gemmatimonadaceae bacterium]
MSRENLANPQETAQAQQLLQAVLGRSATDAEFRQQLLMNPRAAFAAHVKQSVDSIPASFNLVFVENHADATIVLPDPIEPAAELSEQELETVAGGSTVVLATIEIVHGTVALVDAFSEAYELGKKSQ